MSIESRRLLEYTWHHFYKGLRHTGQLRERNLDQHIPEDTRTRSQKVEVRMFRHFGKVDQRKSVFAFHTGRLRIPKDKHMIIPHPRLEHKHLHSDTVGQSMSGVTSRNPDR